MSERGGYVTRERCWIITRGWSARSVDGVGDVIVIVRMRRREMESEWRLLVGMILLLWQLESWTETGFWVIEKLFE